MTSDQIGKRLDLYGIRSSHAPVLVSTHLMSATGTPPPPALVSSPTPPAPTPPALQQSLGSGRGGVAFPQSRWGQSRRLSSGEHPGEECWSSHGCTDDGATPCEWCGGTNWYCCQYGGSYGASSNCGNVAFFATSTQHRCSKLLVLSPPPAPPPLSPGCTELELPWQAFPFPTDLATTGRNGWRRKGTVSYLNLVAGAPTSCESGYARCRG